MMLRPVGTLNDAPNNGMDRSRAIEFCIVP